LHHYIYISLPGAGNMLWLYRLRLRSQLIFIKKYGYLLFLCRLRNVVLSLAGNGTLLWDTSVMYGWEASTKYTVTELLSPDAMRDVALLTQQRMLMDIQ
jgi:hypothetical protein